MKLIEGHLNANDLRIAFVMSRFNEFIVDPLLAGSLDEFTRHGGKKENVTVVKVPGAFEIPLTAQALAKTKSYDALVCLGAIIRGSTTHYDHVAAQVSNGIASVSQKTDVPVIFGVLTTENIEQAIERSGSKAGNQGRSATVTAIEMANLIKKIRMAP